MGTVRTEIRVFLIRQDALSCLRARRQARHAPSGNIPSWKTVLTAVQDLYPAPPDVGCCPSRSSLAVDSGGPGD